MRNKLGVNTQSTLNCRGTILDLSGGLLMGILNLTPDSFSDGGKFNKLEKAVEQAEKMLGEGAGIIDIGGYSSKPGGDFVSEEEEWQRISKPLVAIRKKFPQAILSVDTFRPEIARLALLEGVQIINDIQGGENNNLMWEVLSGQSVPYIMMHMRGNPQNMMEDCNYDDICVEVMDYFNEKLRKIAAYDINDIIIDPGFGFSKTIEQNYLLLNQLADLQLFGKPILAGISKKSMLYKLFDTVPEDTKDVTAALHLKALQVGTSILRVHDVKSAQRILKLHKILSNGAL